MFKNAGTEGEGIELTFGDGVTVIPSYMFAVDSGTPAKLKSAVLSDTITEIGYRAFVGNSTLESINIPDGIDSIESRMFYNCSSLKSLSLPSSVASIGSYAFYGCGSLESINIPDGITDIYEYTFYDCSSLKEIILPETVTNIGKYAFYECGSLESINIPDGITDIYEYTFYNCSSLKEISLPETVTNIDDYAFYGCGTLTEFIIHDSVTSIGKGLFKECSGLDYVRIPESITTIPAEMFYGCSGLESIVIPEGITKINSFAFENCAGLMKINIPDNVTSIGTAAFRGCSSLASVVFPSGIKTIVASMFENCTGLYRITIPDTVTTVSERAFYGCTNLHELVIPYKVKTIGSYAFYNCENLEKIDIPDSVTSVGASAFVGCNNVRFVRIGDGVGSLGSFSFADNTELRTVILGRNIATISEAKFSGCSNLSEICFTANLGTIQRNAFLYCDSLNSIYFNGSSNAISNIGVVGEGNEAILRIPVISFWYVTFREPDGTVIQKDMVSPGNVIDAESLPLEENEVCELYVDASFKRLFDTSTPINDNTTVYVKKYDTTLTNSVRIDGADNAELGEKGIHQNFVFSTNRDVKYISAEVKYSSDLILEEIVQKDFSVDEDFRETVDGYTTLYLTCEYESIEGGNVPKNTALNLFELVFSVSPVTDKESLLIEFVEDSVMTDGNEVYTFENCVKKTVYVGGKFAESISIDGPSEIETPYRFTANILPENASDKNVIWSVDDETLAVVSEDGTLTPLRKGMVTLRATAADGSGVFAEKYIRIKKYALLDSLSTLTGVWNTTFSPDVNEYNVYLPEGATSVRITAKHLGTLVSSTGTKFINGVPKPVSIGGVKTVLKLVYSLDGYDDSVYTINFYRGCATKTTVSADGKTFTVSPVNTQNGKPVIIALYDGSKLVDVQMEAYAGEDIVFSTDKSYTEAKVMVWNSMSTPKPAGVFETIFKEP